MAKMAIVVLCVWIVGMFAGVGSAYGAGKKRAIPPVGSEPGRGPEPHGALVLRVLSYNIQGLPLPKGIDHSRYADIGRILREQREKGTAPHIVALQEAFHGRTDELIRAAGYPHVRKGPGGRGTRFNSGLVILSEFPIVKHDTIVYSECTSWDCMARKGAQYARIELPGAPQPLEFYNTHMNSDVNTDFWTPDEDAQWARLMQVQEVREFMWETKLSQAPSIFPGDFNFKQDAYDYLSFVSFSNMQNAGESCSRRVKCDGDEDPSQDWLKAIDHQFYMGGVSPAMTVAPLFYSRTFKEPVRGRVLSDHPGLEVHYEVRW